MQNPHISIVSTLYRSESFLEDFIKKCHLALESIDCIDFEIVIVNDASPDHSLQKILELKQQYHCIKVIDFSRNFGHHYALAAGMKYAKGSLVFIIDCDLEVDPLVLKAFYLELKKNNYDVVYGYQENRKGKFVEKVLGGAFWKMFNFFSKTKIPINQTTERLMTSRYVDALLQLGDKNIFLAGMMYWSGFIQSGIPVTKNLRKGKSTYTIGKRIALSIDAISSFSAYPLKLLFRVGVLLTLFSFSFGSYLAIRKIISPSFILPGYTSLFVLILFSTGIIVSSLGVFGIYLDKMYNQVKNRPLFIIKDIYE
jgi:putative glycosyltransferase